MIVLYVLGRQVGVYSSSVKPLINKMQIALLQGPTRLLFFFFLIFIYLFIFYLHGIWGLNSLTKDLTCNPRHWKYGASTSGPPGVSPTRFLVKVTEP